MTIANEVWIAAALLQREGREDFSVRELIERILREHLDEYRPGLQVHASNHCVASKAPNPAEHRFLHETARGRRRLYRTGDPFHPNRRSGRTHPSAEALPEKYRNLVEWYENEYDKRDRDRQTPSTTGTRGKVLLHFFRSIPLEDTRSMSEAIRQGCEQVNQDEW